jgi:GTP cyclohydrolase II
LSGARDVARAIDALRRGWPVAVDDTAFLAIETADADALAAFDGEDAPASLLISGNRAATLKLTNQREALPTEPVLIRREAWIDLEAATAIADPALDLAYPLKGPFRTAPLCAPPTAQAALRLARLAGLLPALFTRRNGPAEARVNAADVMTFGGGADLRIVSRAHLPNRFAEKAEILAFRADGDTAEHVALIVGAPSGEPPLVRIHSECLTGDALQDQGYDTVDANHRLGFQDDERDFGVAARMLAKVSRTAIRLLTNNPRKRAALEAEGVEVVEIVPLKVGGNVHNRAYLDTKRDRSGHQL